MKQLMTVPFNNDLTRQQSNDNNNYIDFSIRSFDNMGQTNFNKTSLRSITQLYLKLRFIMNLKLDPILTLKPY